MRGASAGPVGGLAGMGLLAALAFGLATPAHAAPAGPPDLPPRPVAPAPSPEAAPPAPEPGPSVAAPSPSPDPPTTQPSAPPPTSGPTPTPPEPGAGPPTSRVAPTPAPRPTPIKVVPNRAPTPRAQTPSAGLPTPPVQAPFGGQTVVRVVVHPPGTAGASTPAGPVDLRDPFARRVPAPRVPPRPVAVAALDLRDPFAAPRTRPRPAASVPAQALDLRDPFRAGRTAPRRVQPPQPCEAPRTYRGVPLQRPDGLRHSTPACDHSPRLLDPFARPAMPSSARDDRRTV